VEPDRAPIPVLGQCGRPQLAERAGVRPTGQGVQGAAGLPIVGLQRAAAEPVVLPRDGAAVRIDPLQGEQEVGQRERR
jgi:hypothetical protein